MGKSTWGKVSREEDSLSSNKQTPEKKIYINIYSYLYFSSPIKFIGISMKIL